jgi:hypothetical protein
MRSTSIIFSALLFLIGSAFAETVTESPSWSIDLQVGSYMPRIDSQFESSDNSAAPPYETAFGTSESLLLKIGAERHVFSVFGSLSIGVTAGYWSIEGNAVPADGAEDSSAADTTEFLIYPLQLQATYRLDTWANLIPIVPVIRGGLSYYLWRILDGSGEVTQFAGGNEASGATKGWHTSVGVHLLLDFLDEEMAADFERDAGVKNSYLTVEYQYSQVDDFGAADSFRLGDETILIGLTMDL